MEPKSLGPLLMMMSSELSFGLRIPLACLMRFLEFRKNYISQRFIDHKRKEFLELKQGCMSVTEYEREFVRLSQYA
ncbi:2-succinyl-5-enolpyruvyl-6-hydroxy-3-cyclohexene-1-carboxylate synthase [Gossypium australe]|uniref:2-succinyl-5-enolpyruvyl-6-hydroxy-3-cyclohexene-1-carboxylate synthase n=1 Tax=Gossypium australe TaxID=47621 RepID=A0A5B6W8I5_9ROSI|nr:2-succinyl-5-enolpyruvyl-6-hydroxy-3-cyclohexene-1-carboxylate synthase [Gossypium australe]